MNMRGKTSKTGQCCCVLPSRQLFCFFVIFLGLSWIFSCPAQAGSLEDSSGLLTQGQVQVVAQKTGQNSLDEDLLAEELGEDLDLGSQTLQVTDPLQGFNRLMFRVNDWLYLHFLRSGAIFYEHLFPLSWRTGIKNFFHNLRTPVRLGNDVLQARFAAVGKEVGCFVINTLGGFGGLLDPARGISCLRPLPPEQDFGLTLKSWGLGHGCYLVWPVLGPSSLRDSVGLVGDSFLDPISYVKPLPLSVGLNAEDKMNSFSFGYHEYDTLKKGALDPYLAFRDAYFQLRRAAAQR